MNVQYDFKKIQYFTSSLVIFLAILFLCAPINSLRADSTTEPQTTLHKTITPISGQEDQYELSLDITSKLGTETQTETQSEPLRCSLGCRFFREYGRARCVVLL
ncbi:collagen adhesion protein family protein [Streptococcus pneumoniae]|nr:collagen adhesion protein family protein [Streptococcus pneumoniae]